MVHSFGGVFRSSRRRGGKDLHGKLDHLGRGGEASTTTVLAIAIVEAPAVLALFRRGKGVPSAAAAARVIIVGRNQVAALRCVQTEGQVAEAAVDLVVDYGQPLVCGGQPLEEALLGADVHRGLVG